MRPRDLVLCAALVAAGAWFTFVWATSPPAMVAYDIYSYYLPNMLYALQRLRAGGAGLLWNPFQNCGQPSFGISSTGTLYPLNLLFLALVPHRALLAVIAGNFAVAGIGMYCLMREFGTGRAAALCGALAFEFGTATVVISTWTPQVSSAYVWIPAAMFCCERLLRAPSFGGTVGLGAVLAVALLPGSPQCMLFTYQLIVLRVLFEFATRRVARPWLTAASVGLGLALAPLLDAVQLLPGIEMAGQSVRGGSLTLEEIRSTGFLTWEGLRHMLAMRMDISNPVVVVPCVVAGASWLRAATRRRAVFYTLAGGLYLALAFGPATPLFGLYLKLPFGGLFREPARFLWMTSFCLAVLTGLGADAIVRRRPGPAWWHRCSAAAWVAGALAGVYALSPNGLLRVEWTLAGAVVAAAMLAGFGGAWRRVAAVLVVTGPALNLLAYPTPALPATLNAWTARNVPLPRLLTDDRILFTHADLFERLRGEMTAQERLYIVHPNLSFSLMAKSASLFGVPSIYDYEPQPSRRSAAYLVMLQTGAEMTSLRQFYWPNDQNFLPMFSKRLLDLTAVRYLVVDAKADNSAAVVKPPLYPHTVSESLDVVVYENQQALPRAFFVPSVEVVHDPVTLLHRLAFGTDDLRQVALLEEPPPSGPRGGVGPRREGEAEILVDEPERVVIRVQAPAQGYLHLADQWFPGWRATVNGAPAPILRANYLFRAVEVPAGESTVEFRYTPASVRLGAAISAATLLVLAVVARRRRRSPLAA